METSTIHQADGGREEEWAESQQWAELQQGSGAAASIFTGSEAVRRWGPSQGKRDYITKAMMVQQDP
ncbi:hypothetical protein EYF80_019412 [Liparis tanakae]|uniref:Uncharacterized protein n=1 Tax=Liparis tanakae TaxID=230148 RepID=A0A4Z2HX03_9TELE|nr:hypothetical protein EYF80_019412 [Liparis tanakae]